MKTTFLNFVLIFTLLVSAKSQDFSKFPITKIKVTSNVILYKTGLTSANTNMIAFKTSKGIVVVDALQYPEVTKRVRDMIEKDLKGKVAYLIDGHGAYDHTGGNIVFEDVPIIGSEAIPDEMKRFSQMAQSPQFQGFIEQEMIKKPEEMRDEYIGDKREIDESIELNKDMLKRIKDNTLKIVPPNTLVKDEYTLKLGNTTFEMYVNTPSYSRSDIIIYIPEEQTLVVGDIFNKNRLPNINRDTDLKKWQELFEPYINGKIAVKDCIGTHGDLITLDEIKEQFNYLKTLFVEVKKLKDAGKTLEEANQALSLEKLPYLSNYNPYFYGTAMNTHARNISTIWRLP